MSKTGNNPDIVREIGFSLLAEGKTIRVRAEGYSMYPTIKPGSLILIEPVSAGEILMPGEIIAWKRESGLIVHRLIRIYRNNDVVFFFTRGDSCRYEDKPVNPGQIAGRVTEIFDRNGNALKPYRQKRNHCYLYNRLSVWILLKIIRIRRMTGREKV